MRLRLGMAVGVVCATLVAPASAQRGEREPLLDERSYGLAGAVTGSAAGPAAAYYNPGGLADTGGGTAIGASLSLRSYRSFELQDGYISMLGVEDLSDNGFNSVQTFLGAVLKFGPRDATGLQQHALSAGTLVRSSTDRSFVDSRAEAMSGLGSSIEVDERAQTRWFYAAYALRPDPAVSLGLTVAWSYHDYRYRESWSEVSGISGGMPARLTAREARVFYDQHDLFIRLGGQFRPTDWLQLGVMLQAPGIPLFGGGRAAFQRSTVDEGGGSSFFRAEDTAISPQAPAPWQLRVGGFGRVDERFGMGLDVGVTGPVGSANDPVLPLGREAPTDGDLPPATYFADRYWSDYTFDAALGADTVVHPDVRLLVGVSYERSGLPVAEEERDTYLPNSVDHIGGTAAVAINSGQYDFSIGVGYTYGFGSGLRPTAPLAPTYLGTSVVSHEVGFFISGMTSAATQLAMDTYRVMTGEDFDASDEEELRAVHDALEHADAAALDVFGAAAFAGERPNYRAVLEHVDRALWRLGRRTTPPGPMGDAGRADEPTDTREAPTQ